MIQMRKVHKTLVYGDFKVIDIDHPQLFSYVRKDQAGHYLVSINFSEEVVDFSGSHKVDLEKGEVLISNYPDALSNRSGDKFALRPWEAVLIKL